MSLPQRRREQAAPNNANYPHYSSFQSNSVPVSIPPESLDLDLTNSDISFQHPQHANGHHHHQGDPEEEEDDSSRISYTISKPLTKAQQQLRYAAGYPDVRDQIGMVNGGNGNTRRNTVGPSSGTGTIGQKQHSNFRGHSGHPQQQLQHDDEFDHPEEDDDDESTIHEEPSYHPGVARASRMNSLSNNHQYRQSTTSSLLNGAAGIGSSTRMSNSQQPFTSKGEKLGEKPLDRYSSSSRLIPSLGVGVGRQTQLDLEQSDSDHFGGSNNGNGDLRSFKRIESEPIRGRNAGVGIRNSFQVNKPSPLNHSSKPNTSSNISNSQPSQSISLTSNHNSKLKSNTPIVNSRTNPRLDGLVGKKTSNFDSQSESQTSSSSSEEDDEDGHYYNGGNLIRNNSTGVHSALIATPIGSVRSNSPRKDRNQRTKVGGSKDGNNRRPAFRNHEITLDFNKTEELIEKMEGKNERKDKERDLFDVSVCPRIYC